MKIAGHNKITLEATMDWLSTPLPKADLNVTTLNYLNYLQAFSHNGIELKYLSLFNENPDSYTAASIYCKYVAPLFKKIDINTKGSRTEIFSRRITAEATPAFFELEGVDVNTDFIFYYGYDCNYGPAEGIGWQCDNETLITSCPS